MRLMAIVTLVALSGLANADILPEFGYRYTLEVGGSMSRTLLESTKFEKEDTVKLAANEANPDGCEVTRKIWPADEASALIGSVKCIEHSTCAPRFGANKSPAKCELTVVRLDPNDNPSTPFLTVKERKKIKLR